MYKQGWEAYLLLLIYDIKTPSISHSGIVSETQLFKIRGWLLRLFLKDVK